MLALFFLRGAARVSAYTLRFLFCDEGEGEAETASWNVVGEYIGSGLAKVTLLLVEVETAAAEVVAAEAAAAEVVAEEAAAAEVVAAEAAVAEVVAEEAALVEAPARSAIRRDNLYPEDVAAAPTALAALDKVLMALDGVARTEIEGE